MTIQTSSSVLLALLVVVTACNPKHQNEAKSATASNDAGALLSVGSITVDQADLDYQLKDGQGGRHDEESGKKALAELASRAQFVQAAFDADLQHDPMVRAEIARILINRLKEKNLYPQLKAATTTPLPDSRLRELYAAGESRFRSNEKRQVAVLWLNPNGDPQREKQYSEKLTAARDWLFKNGDLKDHPAQGFSVLGVDYSEHQASRYKGGVVGWLESGSGTDVWSKAVAQIAFSLKDIGEVSAVIDRPEGVFLVRYMALKPALLRPFEAVADELRQAELLVIRQSLEAKFNAAIGEKYPVRRLAQ